MWYDCDRGVAFVVVIESKQIVGTERERGFYFIACSLGKRIEGTGAIGTDCDWSMGEAYNGGDGDWLNVQEAWPLASV